MNPSVIPSDNCRDMLGISDRSHISPFRSPLDSVTYKFIPFGTCVAFYIGCERKEVKYVPDTNHQCRELPTSSGVILGAASGERQYRKVRCPRRKSPRRGIE